MKKRKNHKNKYENKKKDVYLRKENTSDGKENFSYSSTRR